MPGYHQGEHKPSKAKYSSQSLIVGYNMTVSSFIIFAEKKKKKKKKRKEKKEQKCLQMC